MAGRKVGRATADKIRTGDARLRDPARQQRRLQPAATKRRVAGGIGEITGAVGHIENALGGRPAVDTREKQRPAGARAIEPGGADVTLEAFAIGNGPAGEDRKSTRLNSSHTVISYAVFCL